MDYGRNSSPFRVPALVRTIGPVFWCLVLASGCLIAAMRLFQGRIAPAIEGRHKYRLPVIGVAVVALYVFVIHHWDKSLNPPPNYDECAVDRLYGLGCIHGTIVDESGKPISHIEVDLIPIHFSVFGYVRKKFPRQGKSRREALGRSAKTRAKLGTGSNLRSHTGASRTAIRAPCFDEEFDCGYRSVSSGSAASLGAVRRNFMSPSPVALPARFLKKSAAVSTAPTFSATAAAIHWFNDTPSSFASRWAAFLMERGSFNG
jgi:hypothetical protein